MPLYHPFHCWARRRRREASQALRGSQNLDILSLFPDYSLFIPGFDRFDKKGGLPAAQRPSRDGLPSRFTVGQH